MGIRRAYTALGVLLIVTFAVSTLGRNRTPVHGAIFWVGAYAMLAFGVVLLTVLLLSVGVAMRALRHRRGPTP